jgi:hypothetical protein
MKPIKKFEAKCVWWHKVDGLNSTSSPTIHIEKWSKLLLFSPSIVVISYKKSMMSQNGNSYKHPICHPQCTKNIKLI